MTKKIITAAINIATIATHEIIAAVSGFKLKITSLLLTTGGEVNITLYDGTTTISGAMDFGGTSEPRGFVSNFGDNALELSPGNAFKIALSAAVQVSGVVCFYYEKV